LQVRLLGLEPRTYGLKVRSGRGASADTQGSCGDAAKNVADCVALLRQEKPELAAVVEAWEALPAAIQAAIVAMVETAQR